MFDPFQRVVLTRQNPAVVQQRIDLLIEDLVNERALARARGAGNADEEPQRKLHIQAAQVVLSRAADHQAPAVWLTALCRHVDLTTSAQEIPRQRLRVPQNM